MPPIFSYGKKFNIISSSTTS